MKASVIVVVHAGAHHLEDSLGSLAAYAERSDVEVVLVDNASPDRAGDTAIARWPSVKVVRSETNLGFAGGVHLGAEAATGDVLVLLNDDAAAPEGTTRLELTVDGPRLGRHTGRLGIAPYEEEPAEFFFPILFDCEADDLERRWRLLWGLGAAYAGYTLESSSREESFRSRSPFSTTSRPTASRNISQDWVAQFSSCTHRLIRS